MQVTRIFSFSHNVFYLSRNKLQYLSHIYFVLCKCFQLDQSKLLSFGKDFEVPLRLAENRKISKTYRLMSTCANCASICIELAFHGTWMDYLLHETHCLQHVTANSSCLTNTTTRVHTSFMIILTRASHV